MASVTPFAFEGTLHGSASGSAASPVSGFDLRITRGLDIVIAAVALLFFAPLMIAIALSVYAADPGPIFFAQRRIGRGGRMFRCLKFRTMATDAEARLQELLRTDPAARAEWDRDHKLRNDPRIVGIGSFLRKSSLDELPQLWSILVGDMSFVGPRPALFNQDDLISLRTQVGVDALVPGLTGWAQVNGRDELPIPEKVKLDAQYLQRQSLGFDIRILWLTFVKVLRRDGVSH